MVVAPAAVKLAGASAILATPEAFVNVVPDAGDIVPYAASVLNVTTVLGTGVPAASFKVAVTVAGDAVLIEVTATPPEVSPIVRVGAAAVVVVPPEVVVEPPEVVVPTPGPHPARIASIVVNMNQAEKFDNFCLH